VRSSRPVFIPPMLATLVAGPFDDPSFLYEIKWDGFRIEAVVEGGDVHLYTRGGQPGEAYFGAFLEPATWIDARSATVDGEVVALGPDGEPDFALLQSRIKSRKEPSTGDPGLVYQAFDLLELDGRSLLDEPLEARKALLEAALRPDARVRYSAHVERDGIAFYEAAQLRGLEGIMAKDRRSVYLPGRRSMAWQKVKIRPEQELVVGGWTAGKGALEGTLGALHVGVYEDGRLRYAGKVGAGFNRAGRDDLLAVLAPLGTSEPPFDPSPPKRLIAGTTWVRPEVVIRAEFAGWTGDGLVRQAAVKGLDLGKDPRAVVREVAGSGR
jgi:bifunctional non-homologous end joining protein LigD